MFAFTGICAVSSLGIDYAQAIYIQKELYAAAETTAQYASSGVTDGTAVSKAVAFAQTLYVNGSNFNLQSSDVQVGTWNSANSTFTSTNTNPNSIWVSYQRSATRGTALKSIFMINQSIDVHGSVIVTYTAGTNTVINVPGGACPWLAGMPSGTTANFTNQGWVDKAPANSPTAASGLTISSGAILTFGYTGAVSYYPGTQPFDPDGNPSWIIDNYYATANGNAEHGMANLKAPLTSVIGVFLDASQPDSTAAPAMLDFSSASSRDFASLSPQLKQPFFIGNGYRADGVTLQNFVVPTGATRLYIGVMDGQQWSDNSGSLSTTVTKPAIVKTVHYQPHP